MANRYIGDVIYDRLASVQGFIGAAQPMIEADWRYGTSTFQDYAKPKVTEAFVQGFRAYGDLSYRYIEDRVMSHLDPERDPWLWAYKNLTGACVDQDTVRKALNAIEGS